MLVIGGYLHEILLCLSLSISFTPFLSLVSDANKVLPERVQSGSVRSLFINHPEPPQQRGGYADGSSSSQAPHLLQASFFQELHRILEPGGMLTIVTDNKW